MPELPEVESVRVALAGELAGRRVEDVRLNLSLIHICPSVVRRKRNAVANTAASIQNA